MNDDDAPFIIKFFVAVVLLFFIVGMALLLGGVIRIGRIGWSDLAQSREDHGFQECQLDDAPALMVEEIPGGYRVEILGPVGRYVIKLPGADSIQGKESTTTNWMGNVVLDMSTLNLSYWEEPGSGSISDVTTKDVLIADDAPSGLTVETYSTIYSYQAETGKFLEVLTERTND